MLYFDNNDKSLCTGCRACEQVCSRGAILFRSDAEGFVYPEIDKNKCTECGRCAIHCHFNKSEDIKSNIFDVYAACAKTSDLLKKSSSGGMFSVIAEDVLKNNGVVFGCAFDKANIPSHISVRKIDELELLRGSKYVESDTKATYSEVLTLLHQGKKVLYSGCPCQIAGLKSFLGKPYENLYTIDIICHGVPSRKLFKKYLGWLSEKNKSEIKGYKFRSKKYGWKHCAEYSAVKKTKYVDYRFDPYYTAFINGETYRESCYKCKYAAPKRVGDITLGDYWGIEIAHPEFNGSKGVSLILVNTEKGREMFERIKDNVYYIPSSFEKASKKNGNLISPSSRPLKRDYIYNGIDELNDVGFINKNLKIPVKTKIKGFILKLIPYNVKVVLKRLLK